MTDSNRRDQHTTPRDARTRRGSRPSAASRKRSISISDAVIAAYIHELRHEAAAASAPGRD